MLSKKSMQSFENSVISAEEEIYQLVKDIKCNEISKSQEYVFRFWSKYIENNKAIIKLIELEFYSEAFSIYRLSIEHQFNIFSLIEKEGYIEKLINHDQHQIPKLFKELSKSTTKDNTEVLTQENKKILEEKNNEYTANPIKYLGHNVYNSAQGTTVDFLYDTVYRHLSLGHAHSTLLSILKTFEHKDMDNLFLELKSNLDMLLILIKDDIENTLN